jgi:hypothetical protein
MTVLSDSALATLAGVPVRVIRAIQRVESSGNPRAVRFETRLFRERTGITIEGTARSTFEQAYRVDARAAVESSSWGLYQVLGAALIRLFGSPAAGVQAFDADPRSVSDRLLVEWFRSRPRAQVAANESNWPELARLYNGSATSPWLGRFLSFLEPEQAVGLGIAGTLMLAGAGWAAFRLYKGLPVVPNLRGLGDAPGVLVEYETKPRAGRRPAPAICERLTVRVENQCQSKDSTCELRATARGTTGRTLARLVGWYSKRDKTPVTVEWASAIDGGDSLRISSLSEDLSGCGVGTRLYEAMAKAACELGRPMQSDKERFRSSDTFWRKQEAKGRAEWVGEDRSLFRPGDDRQARGQFVISDPCTHAGDLGDPRGYIRKPKPAKDYREAEFWREARQGDGVFKKGWSKESVDRAVAESLKRRAPAAPPSRRKGPPTDEEVRAYWAKVRAEQRAAQAPARPAPKRPEVDADEAHYVGAKHHTIRYGV